MRITKWGEYGILCSLYLARSAEGTTVGASELANEHGIPLQYAQQILHRLKKGGIITSVRGPHGGYCLAKLPHQISLRAVLLAAEGETFDMLCASHPPYEACTAAGEACGLRSVWQELKSAIDQLLESHTLSSMLDKHVRFQAAGSRLPII